MRILGAFLILTGLGLVSWALFQPKGSSGVRTQASVGAGASAHSYVPGASIENLKRDTRTNALYKRPAAEQTLLFKTVEHFCVKSYHRDSCLHHLITCGTPCLVAIPETQRKKIFDAYVALRQERGLPQLPNVPHSPDTDDY